MYIRPGLLVVVVLMTSSCIAAANQGADWETGRRQGLFQQLSGVLSRLSPEVLDRLVDEFVKTSELFQDVDVRRMLYDMKTAVLMERNRFSAPCETCMNFANITKFLLERFSYEELEWPVIRLCYELMESNLPNAEPIRREELCNGSVMIQGPHVATVLQWTTSDRLCEFQNACPPSLSNINIPSKTAREKHIAPAEPASKSAREKHIAPAEPASKTAREKRREPAEKAAAIGLHVDHSLTQDVQKSKRFGGKATISVAQLADIHIDTRYLVGGVTDCGLPTCCLEEYGPGSSGLYGDYTCDIPPRTIETFLDKVATDYKPDIIVYTGDISGSRVWDETQDEVLLCTSTLTDAIKTYLPNHRVYPSLGNHETYPTNLFYRGMQNSVDILKQLADWWAPVAGMTSDQLATMTYGGYYSMADRPGLRVLSYNSNFMYTRNWYNIMTHDNRTDVEEMKMFVQRELQFARARQEKVILLGHHPPASGDYLIEQAHWYRDVILQYSDVIVLQVVGHTHSDKFHLVTDDDGVHKSMVYVAPPVTPGGTKNPSMRIYHLDATTFEVLDYDQYYMRLTEANANVTNPQIELLYSAKLEYDLPDMSPNTWSSFVDRLEEDQELLLRHRTHYNVDAQQVTCDEWCKRDHVCGLRHITNDAVRLCVDDYYNDVTTTMTPGGAMNN